MPEIINAQCGACGRQLKLKDSLAGKRVKCPECASPVDVPLASSSAGTARPARSSSGSSRSRTSAATETGSRSRSTASDQPRRRRSEGSSAPRSAGQARKRAQRSQPEYLDDYGDDYGDVGGGYDDPWDTMDPAAYGQMPGATMPAAASAAPQLRGSGSAPPPPAVPRSSGIKLGSVLAGAGMMVGAVVWFVAGLAGGVIFFYPPVLLIIGLVTMVKGFLGGE